MNYPMLYDRGNRRQPKQRNVFASSAKGAAAAAAAGVALALASAAVLSGTGDPAKFLTPVGIAILYASAAVGGFFAHRSQKDSALLAGLISGGMLTAASFAGSLLFLGSRGYSAGLGFPVTLALRCGAVIFSIIGALISANRRPRKKSRRKRKVR